MQRAGVEAIQYNKQAIKAIDLRFRLSFDKETLFLALIAAAALLYSVIVIVPILTLFKESGLKGIVSAVANTDNFSAVWISLFTSTLTLVMVFIIGTPVVYLLTRTKSGVFTKVFEILIGIPTVLPPAVAGIGLLLAFGRDGFFGGMLNKINIEVVFTPIAVILAQFFVSAAFYVQVLKNGVDSVSRDILDASYIFGAGKIETFMKVILPMLKKTVIAGLVLSWTRAMGEFGATIMFAGNVLGRTRTAPLQIYTLMQTNIKYAASLSVVMLIISSIMFLMTKLLIKEN